MHLEKKIKEGDLTRVRTNLLEFARAYDFSCILDSNSEGIDPVSRQGVKYDLVAGFANQKDTYTLTKFSDLESIDQDNTKWLLGFLTYDLKNKIEDLSSSNTDHLQWPSLFFFEPEILVTLQNLVITIQTKTNSQTAESIFGLLLDSPAKTQPQQPKLQLEARMSSDEYCEKFHQIQTHIKKGNIYETNFCQEFFQTKKIDPFNYYHFLCRITPSPFSTFFRHFSNYLISASPERFLKKTGSRIISQPIKGTAGRGKSTEEDEKILKDLLANPKERSENIMIVDLVRNDLSRISKANSVHVDELCEIYSFPKVHQLISTISCEIENQNFGEIISATFPMGSMTGAPKVEAMKIAEDLELTKRGLYSGAVGYITPGMNFDFNVVIRSLQYQAETNYLSYLVGSAITSLSDPDLEYEECLLKVYGLNRTQKAIHYA